jgi:1-acyl-sn-glycerol-3-phosphate acyltransferase
MIKSRHIPFYVWLFDWYSRIMLRRHFHDINIKSDVRLRKVPAVVIANHFSWWDGFFVVYINSRMFHKKLHVMMLEEQLKKHRILSKAGAFSVERKKKSVLESIEYCIYLLNDPGNLLLFYPQGEIESAYHYPVKFEKGLLKILEGSDKEFQLIFLAALTDYFSNKKPVLNLNMVEYSGNYSHDAIEKAYNDFLINCIQSQKE